MNPPNPEIYRLAAKYIEGYVHKYACLAIHAAARELSKKPGGETWRYMHVHQYQRMFQPDLRCDSHLEKMWRKRVKNEVDTSFWNQEWTFSREERRIKSLLLMADICEGKVTLK